MPNGVQKGWGLLVLSLPSGWDGRQLGQRFRQSGRSRRLPVNTSDGWLALNLTWIYGR